MKTRPSLISCLIPSAGVRAALLLVSALFAVSGIARGQIFVANANGSTGIIGYNLDGTPASPSQLASGPGFMGLALSGTTIYATSNYGNIKAFNFDGTSASLASGNPYDPTVVSGLAANNPYGIAVSGNGATLFVTGFSDATIRAYNTSNGSAASGFTPITTGLLNPAGIAVSGSSLFVSDVNTTEVGAFINAYTTTGAVLGGFTPITTGLSGPVGLAVSGNSLFVANQYNGTIGEYNAITGETINAALITLPEGSQPTGIAVGGSNLFVTDAAFAIVRAYTLSGAEVSFAQIPGGLNGPYGIVATGSAIPEPSTYAAFAGAAMLGFAAWRRRNRKNSPAVAPSIATV